MKLHTTFLYAVSLLFHAALAGAMIGIDPPVKETAVKIVVRDVPAPPPPPPVEAPPPPPPEAPAAPPKARPAPQKVKPKAEPAPAPNAIGSDIPELGVAMTGAVGNGGIAVPVGDPRGAPKQKKAEEEVEAKPLARAGCAEAASKPKVIELPEPAYDETARQERVEGRVRLKITVAKDGSVRGVAIVEPLHPGLDASAVRAAKAARFEPAIACGAAVEATFTISIRFAL